MKADTFVITPAKPYSDDDLNWTEDNARVNREHENKNLQNVKLKTTKVKNWKSYRRVLIGYPIWWGDAAWPVNQFVKNNNFQGKTVYTFCTSASSGIGDSTSTLKKMAKGGKWKAGYSFSEDADMSEVSGWTRQLKK